MCTPCKQWEYMEDEFTCVDCGFGNWPYSNKTSCYELPQQFMQWSTVFAIVPVVVASVGILLTLAVIIIFLKHNDTPLVKASGRELSYMLLSGMLICYVNTFLLLSKPSAFVCALQRY